MLISNLSYLPWAGSSTPFGPPGEDRRVEPRQAPLDRTSLMIVSTGLTRRSTTIGTTRRRWPCQAVSSTAVAVASRAGPELCQIVDDRGTVGRIRQAGKFYRAAVRAGEVEIERLRRPHQPFPARCGHRGGIGETGKGSRGAVDNAGKIGAGRSGAVVADR